MDQSKRWTWEEFRALPHEPITADIHCVTKWSKLDTHWEGVSVDTLLAGIESVAEYVVAFCDGGYTTNLPLEAVTGGKAWVVYAYDGQPIAPEHGGPARLLVPQRYFWKSAKWVRGLRLVEEDDADSGKVWPFLRKSLAVLSGLIEPFGRVFTEKFGRAPQKYGKVWPRGAWLFGSC